MAVVHRCNGLVQRRGLLPTVGSEATFVIATVSTGDEDAKAPMLDHGGGSDSLHLALGGSAQAMTCSVRLQVCHGYCVKSMGACHAKCRQFSQECMASGCWESRVVAKQCGFTRQQRR